MFFNKIIYLTFGSQHPAATGVMRHILAVCGEQTTGIDSKIKYIHLETEEFLEHETCIRQELPYFDKPGYAWVSPFEHIVAYLSTDTMLLMLIILYFLFFIHIIFMFLWVFIYTEHGYKIGKNLLAETKLLLFRVNTFLQSRKGVRIFIGGFLLSSGFLLKDQSVALAFGGGHLPPGPDISDPAMRGFIYGALRTVCHFCNIPFIGRPRFSDYTRYSGALTSYWIYNPHPSAILSIPRHEGWTSSAVTIQALLPALDKLPLSQYGPYAKLSSPTSGISTVWPIIPAFYRRPTSIASSIPVVAESTVCFRNVPYITDGQATFSSSLGYPLPLVMYKDGWFVPVFKPDVMSDTLYTWLL